MGGAIWSKETRRVTKIEALNTISWLETLLHIPLMGNMLGSTGIAETSGDIDLGLEFHTISKEELRNKLTDWIKVHWSAAYHDYIRQWIKNNGINVCFKAPINGRLHNGFTGFVQTDFMFGEDLEWMKFVYRANIPEGSPYKGFHRHILMSSIVKSLNPKWKWNQIVGLVHRHDPSDILISNQPEEIARLLLGNDAVVSDLDNVESIYKALENDPLREAKVKDFEDNIAKHPLK